MGYLYFVYAAAFLLLLLFLAVKILREYERGVIFFLGRFYRVKGPGLIIVIPAIQQMVRVDLRTIVLDVPTQDVISKDNVSVKVNAVIYFRVMDPERAIVQVENFHMATSQLAQTTLRSVLGQHELDEMLSEREKLNQDIQEILDKQTDTWGIKVSNVEILVQAAEVMSQQPQALTLRYLQTMIDIPSEKSTILFPLPMDLLSSLSQTLGTQAAGNTRGS